MSVIIIIVTSATDELRFSFSALLMGQLQADLTLDQYNGSGPVISVQLKTFQARPVLHLVVSIRDLLGYFLCLL